MHITHINNDYFYSSLYKLMVDEQRKQGVKCDVFFPSIKNRKENVGSDNGVKIVKAYGKIERFFYYRKQHKLFNAINIQINKGTDLVHAHFLFSAGYFAYKFKKQNGTPYIVVVQNTDINFYLKFFPYLRPLCQKILIDASAIVFLNKPYLHKLTQKYIKERYKNEIIKKFVSIPCGIDPFWLDNIRKEAKTINGKTLNIISVGLIDKNKNMIGIAKAIEILVNKGYCISLSIAGKVSNNKVFKKLLKYEFVHYLGYLDCEQLKKEYELNDIFILPSIYETFGLVYVEALTQGLPIIYSKGQGFDDQYDEGFIGYSVNPLSYEDIAKKIELIYKNYNNMSKRCIEVCEKYNWTYICKLYLHIYDKAINDTKK